MKNKRISAIIYILTLSLLFTACSNGSKKKSKNSKSRRTKSEEEDDDDDDDDDNDSKLPQYSGAPDYLGPDGVTWFEQKGLKFTECGNFKMNLLSGGQIIQVPAKIEIETNYDCEDGWKNIVATTEISIGQAAGFHFWTSSFDKYTGASFEFQNGSNSLYDGCNIINEGDVQVVIGEYDYTFHICEHITLEDNVTMIVYTITCPYEYDGTVLQYGYCDEMGSTNHDFNSGKIWLADDFTDMYGYYDYFTLEGFPDKIL